MTLKLNNVQREQLIRDYQSGIPATVLELTCPISSSQIYHVLKRVGIRRRSNSEVNRKYLFNENAFDDLTDEAAYWIGFIAADGTIQQRSKGCSSLTIRLAGKDSGHIYKFRSFLKSNHPISLITFRKRYSSAGITIHSAHLVERLKCLGVTQRKSFTFEPHPELIHNRHFWRGMVDGDGHVGITNKGSAVLTLVGSQASLNQFNRFLQQSLHISKRVRRHSTIWKVVAVTNDAVAIMRLLYGESDIALERKEQKARAIIKEWDRKNALLLNCDWCRKSFHQYRNDQRFCSKRCLKTSQRISITRKILPSHGYLASSHCSSCRREYDRKWKLAWRRQQRPQNVFMLPGI